MKDFFIYLREDGKPVACVAIHQDGPRSAYQVSSLNPGSTPIPCPTCSQSIGWVKDQFSRTTARAMAKGRLAKRPIPVVLEEVEPFNSTVAKILTHLSNGEDENQGNHQRARLAAIAYLKEEPGSHGVKKHRKPKPSV